MKRLTRNPEMIERIGGLDGMRGILQDFYARLFQDPMIGFFFAGRDVELLVERQLQFTARAFGMNVLYEGKSLPDAHAPLAILPGHFDRRHELLRQVLVAHRVPQEVQDAWLDFDYAFRKAVLKIGSV